MTEEGRRHERIERLVEVLVAMASGDLARRIPISPGHDDLDAVAFGVNSIVDELSFTTATLERLRAQAEEASRKKSLFVRNISHELRTPLAAILGMADLLAHTRDGEPRRDELLARIHRNGQALLGLLDDLLELSRLEADRLEVELRSVDLADLCCDVLGSFEGEARARGLALHGPFAAAGAPSTVLADERRTRQILMNLVGNAVKFTPSGAVEVRIGAAPNQLVAVDVIDSGVGLTAAEQATLFEPFTQARLTTAPTYGGTGLGLMLSRGFAEAMGGRLEIAASAPGRGTTMRLTLPSPAEAVRTPRRRGGERSGTPFAPTLTGSRLLIAEDDEDIRDAMGELLALAGAQIVTAPDGKDAVELANAQPIDLVVMDIRMPFVDGLTATRQLRAAGFGAPILALTADAVDDSRDEARAAGCDAWIRKPVDPRLLIETIASLLATSTFSTASWRALRR